MPLSACSLPGPGCLATTSPSSQASKEVARTTLKWQFRLNNQRGFFVLLTGARASFRSGLIQWLSDAIRERMSFFLPALPSTRSAPFGKVVHLWLPHGGCPWTSVHPSSLSPVQGERGLRWTLDLETSRIPFLLSLATSGHVPVPKPVAVAGGLVATY